LQTNSKKRENEKKEMFFLNFSSEVFVVVVCQ